MPSVVLPTIRGHYFERRARWCGYNVCAELRVADYCVEVMLFCLSADCDMLLRVPGTPLYQIDFYLGYSCSTRAIKSTAFFRLLIILPVVAIIQ